MWQVATRHISPITGLQDGDDRTWQFTYKITILNMLISWHGGGKEWFRHVLPTMSSIRGTRWSWWCQYSTEKCIPDSHLPFVYIVILSVSPLWRTGDTNSLGKTSKILFWIVLPTLRKSCHRPWLQGLKTKAKLDPWANLLDLCAPIMHLPFIYICNRTKHAYTRYVFGAYQTCTQYVWCIPKTHLPRDAYRYMIWSRNRYHTSLVCGIEMTHSKRYSYRY